MSCLLDLYANGDTKGIWDKMKIYVFGSNKFYLGLTSRRIAEYLLFTAETTEEIEAAYQNTYESINANYRDRFYTTTDLIEIKKRIKSEDEEGLKIINKMIENSQEIEIG